MFSSMERFNNIFNKSFSSSQEAIDYCQRLSHTCGFSVRIRTSKSTTIYIVCSREGRPESKHDASIRRNRTSDRCNCKWKVILQSNNTSSSPRWEFRAGKTMVHNHSIPTDNLVAKVSSPLENSQPSTSSYPFSSSPISSAQSVFQLPPLSQALNSIMSDDLPIIRQYSRVNGNIEATIQNDVWPSFSSSY